MASTSDAPAGSPPAPRRPDPRDVPKRTPLVARPVGAESPAAAHPAPDGAESGPAN